MDDEMKLRWVERVDEKAIGNVEYVTMVKVLQYQEEPGRAWVDVPLEVEE